MLIIWALEHGGYPATTWYPGALFLLAALVLAALALPRRAPVPRATAIAAVLLFAYAGWSYLSIGWADDGGVAWDAANRTALFATVFALVALWPMRARPAAVALGVLAFAVAAIGVGELIACAGSSHPEHWFISARFADPAGYANANVALWMIAFFPCVALGGTRSVPPSIRAAALASAVVVGELALLGQSRAWQFAAPIAALVFIAAARERTRTVFALLAVVVAGALAAGPVLDVYDTIIAGDPIGPAIGSARDATIAAAIVLGVLAYVAAVYDRRVAVPEKAARTTGRALAVTAACVALLAVALVVTSGDFGSRVSRAWHTFVKGTEPEGPNARFGVTLGSQRYDFWRVAWHQFKRAPLTGAGADNFQQDYLRERRSDQEPRYPHSVEMRTLGQTGLIGLLLFGGAIVAGIAGALRAVRARPPGPGGAAAVGGLAVFAYWLVHASGDWLFEYSGVAAAAFAALGLACALQPRVVIAVRGRRRAAATRRRSLLRAGAALAAVLLALSLVGPWLAERYVQNAAASWKGDPKGAFDDLSRAASLNPLSARAQLVAGTIALQLGRKGEAAQKFRAALDRNPADTYALLELGVLSADGGDAKAGKALLARAHSLNPRDDTIAGALDRLEHGKRVDLAAINATILQRSRLHLRVRP
ncbi:MAG: hypothetical protein QOG63_450 [Thermoleophilaceae bacterium]|nr:hypothetical protein [Thermoleophilaceae bacterium]